MEKMVMEQEFKNIFHNKSVFITGHTGFKGSWLSLWLTLLGAKVTGYALKPETDNSLFNKLGLEKKINHVIGDIRDADKLQQAMLAAKPAFVFHLAAQALVRKSYQEAPLTFSTNIMGGVNILEAVKNCPTVQCLIFITSDKCYMNKEWIWGYRENDVLGGIDPYSASKACAELVFKSYSLSYFSDRADFGCATVRAGNVIGGGDTSLDRIIPDIVRAIASDAPLVLRHPNATRPWQHVLDPLKGYLDLAKFIVATDNKGYSGESFNFGPATSSIKTVLEVVQTFVKNRFNLKLEIQPVANAYESTLLHLSIDKATSILNWHPKYDFANAVDKTAQWYSRVGNGEDALAVTIEQIEDFMRLG